ncbi:AfsR/SARP family transcriptional regulator [Streptomyces sp. NPDC001514]
MDLGPPKRRVLLARLLVDRGRPVSAERLCRDLWSDDTRPAGAVATVHAHISRLRTVLEPGRPAGARSTLLVNESGGYVLRAPREALDSAVFEGLLEKARQHRREARVRAALMTLEEALRLWRGPALHDATDHDFAVAEVDRLHSLRNTAEELHVATLLELGQADAAVPLAEKLTNTAPWREVSWALLMKALYATGRSAEALQRYERFRVALAEELGVDPGLALRDLHLAILNEDTSLILPAAGRADSPPAPRPGLPAGRLLVPLPLTGRNREVEVLTEAVAQAGAGGVRWGVVRGGRGTGRTRLLEEVAQRARREGARIARLTCCCGGDDCRSTTALGPATRLAEQLTGPGEPVSRATRWTEEAALKAVTRALAEGPALLLMDDVDTVCRACRRLLRRLSALLSGERTMILCSAGERDGTGTASLPAGVPEGRITTVRLSPLTVEDVRALLPYVDDGAPAELSDEAGRLRRRSDGNPFVLTELLRLPRDERRSESPPTPPAVRRAVLTRLDVLSGQARALVTQAAACGDVLDMDLLAVLMGVARDELIEPAERAVRTGLIVWSPSGAGPAGDREEAERAGRAGAGCYRFHSIMREAVLSTLSPVRRQQIHASVASALRKRPHSPVSVAEQIVQAGPVVSSDELRAASRPPRLRNAKPDG